MQMLKGAAICLHGSKQGSRSTPGFHLCSSKVSGLLTEKKLKARSFFQKQLKKEMKYSSKTARVILRERCLLVSSKSAGRIEITPGKQ